MYVCILICNKILSALFLIGINNNGKSDVVFLVDSASSSNKKKFRKTLAFIKDYVSDANIDHGDVRVGLIISNQKNYVRFYLNQFSTKHEVLDALEVTSYKQGRSNLAESLKIMRNQVFSERFGDRADAPNFALLLLNNQSHSTNSDVIDVEFDLAQKEGIHIFAFDIGESNLKCLEDVFLKPSE